MPVNTQSQRVNYGGSVPGWFVSIATIETRHVLTCVERWITNVDKLNGHRRLRLNTCRRNTPICAI